MTDDHISALAELANEQDAPRLATMDEIKALGKKKIFKDANYPYPSKMKRAEYEEIKQNLQIELLKMQGWVKETGQRVVILCEGRDAAGKGGTIKRIMEHLNPRGARVVALEKPSADESGQWYFQRYIKHMPTRGEIVLFDRSWYNRAGVERVMGFCKPSEYLEFMRQAPEVERMLVRSGIKLFKLCSRSAVTNSSGASRAASMIRSNNGSSVPSTWHHWTSGRITPRQKRRCFSIRTRPMHPGRW